MKQAELSATNKYMCPICQTHFKIEREMKTHMTQTHKELKTDKASSTLASKNISEPEEI